MAQKFTLLKEVMKQNWDFQLGAGFKLKHLRGMDIFQGHYTLHVYHSNYSHLHYKSLYFIFL